MGQPPEDLAPAASGMVPAQHLPKASRFARAIKLVGYALFAVLLLFAVHISLIVGSAVMFASFSPDLRRCASFVHDTGYPETVEYRGHINFEREEFFRYFPTFKLNSPQFSSRSPETASSTPIMDTHCGLVTIFAGVELSFGIAKHIERQMKIEEDIVRKMRGAGNLVPEYTPNFELRIEELEAATRRVYGVNTRLLASGFRDVALDLESQESSLASERLFVLQLIDVSGNRVIHTDCGVVVYAGHVTLSQTSPPILNSNSMVSILYLHSASDGQAVYQNAYVACIRAMAMNGARHIWSPLPSLLTKNWPVSVCCTIASRSVLWMDSVALWVWRQLPLRSQPHTKPERAP